MLRILFITRKFPPQVGGMENFSFNIFKFFKRRKDCEITKIILKRSQIHLIWWYPFALVQALWKAPRVDVIFLGDLVLSLIGWLIKLVYKKPVAVTVHGLDVTYPLFFYQWYLRYFGRKFDRYFCISRYSREQAEARGFGPCQVITIGVDFQKLQDGSKVSAEEQSAFYEKYQIPAGRSILLTVGRLVARKGQFWFIQNVLPSLPERIIYLVVGAGEQRSSIEDLIRRLRLQKRVFLLGRIPEKDLKVAYCLADIFVMPNIKVRNDMEGFGLTAVEAALNGLPVVAAGIEGIRDAIADRKNGLLVRSKNSRDFKGTITRLLTHPQECQLFGQRAQAYTREHCDWQVIVGKYFREFLQLRQD